MDKTKNWATKHCTCCSLHPTNQGAACPKTYFLHLCTSAWQHLPDNWNCTVSACLRCWKDTRQKTLWVGLSIPQAGTPSAQSNALESFMMNIAKTQPTEMQTCQCITRLLSLCSSVERWQLPGGGRWSDPFLSGCSMRILDLKKSNLGDSSLLATIVIWYNMKIS